MSTQLPTYAPTVLLSFRAENVRSYRDELELWLQATALAERPFVRSVPAQQSGKEVRVLPAAAIYGANASGKSNVLRAIEDMRRIVARSFDPASDLRAIRAPFRLDRVSRERPSRFELELIVAGTRWHYGFAIDDERVLEEWAIAYPHGRARRIFKRTSKEVDTPKNGATDTLRAFHLCRDDALLLSTAAAVGHSDLAPLYRAIARRIHLVRPVPGRMLRQAYTASLLQSESTRGAVLALLRAADLGIEDARVLEDHQLALELSDLDRSGRTAAADATGDRPRPSARVLLGVLLSHRAEGETIELEPEEESDGTLAWLGLIGPALDVLREGKVLMLDEIDTSLHPALVERLVALFQEPETNPRCAQLIFTTHDVTLLEARLHTRGEGRRLLGRDQVWLTEKMNDGSSRLYPLGDHSPRRGEAIAERYLAGYYGATPSISEPELRTVAAALHAGNGSGA